MSLRLAISMGDYNGIGPEIILKSLTQLLALEATPVVIGHFDVFDFYADVLDLRLPGYHKISDPSKIKEGMINFLNIETEEALKPSPGRYSKKTGGIAMRAVEKGITCCLDEHTQALVTAPISKEAINKAGYHYPGHTEFLAEKTSTDDYMMLLVHDKLRVGLVSIHIPVAEVAGAITRQTVQKNIRIMHAALKDDFGIHQPRIAVMGLNPHAGDGGIIGREEIDFIQPALKRAKSEGIEAKGPFPADGFFGNKQYKQYDGVLAMYHDQGLVPFKTISFGGGVNVTAGLPIVRTSPDHGTAFDIAGKNTANPSSFLTASKLAIRLINNRLNNSSDGK